VAIGLLVNSSISDNAREEHEKGATGRKQKTAEARGRKGGGARMRAGDRETGGLDCALSSQEIRAASVPIAQLPVLPVPLVEDA